ncbi:MAG: DUF116 domain-containing protein [Chromatiales bacterium]|jgi:lipoate-protein ligase A
MSAALTWHSRSASAPQNHALDAFQAKMSRAEGRALLRFYGSFPSVSLGLHEDPLYAARVGYCEDAGIPIVRRMTGGGALYLDHLQLCWTLTAPAASGATLSRSLEDLTRQIASSLSAELHIPVQLALPNDLEVNGRKLGSVFAMIDEGLLIAHGTLFLDLDVEGMLKALRIPKEKLSEAGIQSAAQRFVALSELLPDTTAPERATEDAIRHGIEAALGQGFEVGHTPARQRIPVSGGMHPRPERALEAFRQVRGGTLYARITLDAAGSHVDHVSFSGDVDVRPAGLLKELAAALYECPIHGAESEIADFLERREFELLGFEPRDLQRLVRQALSHATEQRVLNLSLSQANTLMVHDPDGGGNALDILRRAEVVLLPYCAKPPWCKWRHEEGCSECGLCEVGDAYRMARERGLGAVTIRNFEHLEATLADLKADGVEAYVGMCCRNFYIKREHAFREAGIPAVLLDIEGSNCYELQQEDLAYRGEFEAEARLNGDVVEKVMRYVPSPHVAPVGHGPACNH